MRAVLELIHRRDALESISSRNQDRRIARKRAGIAGDADDEGDLRGRELAGLRFGAGARRIEDDGVELCQFRRKERPAKQVANFARHLPQAGRRPRRLVERRDRAAVGLDRVDLGALRKAQREWPAAREEIRDRPRVAAGLRGQSGKGFLAKRASPAKKIPAARRRRRGPS